jgi:hypothetical protein
VNLYGFVENDGVSRLDYLGQAEMAPAAGLAGAVAIFEATKDGAIAGSPGGPAGAVAGAGAVLIGAAVAATAVEFSKALDSRNALKKAEEESLQLAKKIALLTAAHAAAVAHQRMCDELNDAVQAAKDAMSFGKGQAACRCDMSCGELKIRQVAWLRLATARAKRDMNCWGGGDLGHQVAQAAAWAHVGNCAIWLKWNSCN